MFEATTNPAARTAMDNAHAARGHRRGLRGPHDKAPGRPGCCVHAVHEAHRRLAEAQKGLR